MGSTITYALPYPELTDVANVPADMRELAEAVEGKLTAPGDTGWVAVTINAGFGTAGATMTPQVRRIGKVVYARGGVAATGIPVNAATGSVMTIPTGFRPATQDVIGRAGTSVGTAAATIWVKNGTGLVDIRTNATASSWYVFGGMSWLID